MSTTLTQIAYQAQRDLCELRTGQTASADMLVDFLALTNEMLDQWAMQRFFIYTGSTGAWAVLAAFPDVTTAYNFAPGNLMAIRKGLAQKMAPMIKYAFKIPEPMLEQIAAEAAEAVAILQGVGPQ